MKESTKVVDEVMPTNMNRNIISSGQGRAVLISLIQTVEVIPQDHLYLFMIKYKK